MSYNRRQQDTKRERKRDKNVRFKPKGVDKDLQYGETGISARETNKRYK